VAQPSVLAQRTELVLDDETLSPTTVALAAARAHTVRIRQGMALPTRAAVRALVALLDDAIVASGRSRADVPVVLEVEAVVARDEADAARRRTNLALAAAFSHATWHADAALLVASAAGIDEAARALAAEVGVDRVELVPVGAAPLVATH